MLSDRHIDDLEKALFTAHRADMPLLIGKWLPVLFAELRVARSALESNATQFLSGDIPDAAVRPVDPSSNPEGHVGGLQIGDEHRGGPAEVEPVATEGSVAAAAPVESGKAKRQKASRRSKPRGNREASGPYQGLVVPGGGEPEVGGEDDASRGGEPGSVEADPGLTALPMLPPKEVPEW